MPKASRESIISLEMAKDSLAALPSDVLRPSIDICLPNTHSLKPASILKSLELSSGHVEMVLLQALLLLSFLRKLSAF
ncbi:MAG: hypothetical protein QXG01_02370 [Candidatus Bathyarchaeia archaeon]